MMALSCFVFPLCWQSRLCEVLVENWVPVAVYSPKNFCSKERETSVSTYEFSAIYCSCFSNIQYFALSLQKLLKLNFQLTPAVSAVTIGEFFFFMK